MGSLISRSRCQEKFHTYSSTLNKSWKIIAKKRLAITIWFLERILKAKLLRTSRFVERFPISLGNHAIQYLKIVALLDIEIYIKPINYKIHIYQMIFLRKAFVQWIQPSINTKKFPVRWWINLIILVPKWTTE